MNERLVSSTAHPMLFALVSSTDHLTAVTGATPTVVISKDGGAFASPSGAVSEIGNGWYALAGNATDRNTLGAFALHATATGADPWDEKYSIVGYDPFNGTNLGLTDLDAAISSRSTYAGGAVASVTGNVGGSVVGDVEGKVLGGGSSALSAVGVQADIEQWRGSAPNALVGGKIDAVNSVHAGTAQAGSTTSITLDSGASSSNGIYSDNIIEILSGTGAHQSALISTYNGTTKVAAVVPNFVIAPDSTSVFVITPGGIADLWLWGGQNTNALSSRGNVTVDIEEWRAAIPATLSTSGFVETMLMRWLTDSAGGTPLALSSGEVQSTGGGGGGGSDPWSTVLPGAYTPTQAGYLLARAVAPFLSNIVIPVNSVTAILGNNPFVIAQGDTQTPLTVQFQRGGAPYDLTGYTSITFRMWAPGGTTDVINTQSNVSVLNAKLGTVSYQWQTTDVDGSNPAIPPGKKYHAAFVVVDSSGKPITYPNTSDTDPLVVSLVKKYA